MTNSNDHKLKDEINHLEEAMHDADQFHTLEEQVADMSVVVLIPVAPTKNGMMIKKKMMIGAMRLGKKMVSGA